MKSYKELYLFIREKILPPMSDTEASVKLGFSLKTHYNLMKGQSVGMQTKQTLIKIMNENGYKVIDSGDKVKIEEMEKEDLFKEIKSMNQKLDYIIGMLTKGS